MATSKTAKADEVLTEEVEVKATKKVVEHRDEETTIFLFKDSDKYKDDVFVGINGKRYQIKRGEPVKVPRNVAKVLERSMSQDMARADMIAGLESEFVANARKFE